MSKMYQLQNITKGTSALVIYRPMPVELPTSYREPITYPAPRDYFKDMYEEDKELLRHGSLKGRQIEQLKVSDKLFAIACFLVLIVATFFTISFFPLL